MKTIGEKIKELRKTKGASQEDLAFELGVSRQTIHKWECNATQPSADNLKALCDYFKISSDYFISINVVSEEVATSDCLTKVEDATVIGKSNNPKSKKHLVVCSIFIIVVSLLFIISILFTLGIGFLVFSDNLGFARTSMLIVDNSVFYFFLALNIILFALDICLVFYLKKCLK